jgi:hypothetical protein
VPPSSLSPALLKMTKDIKGCWYLYFAAHKSCHVSLGPPELSIACAMAYLSVSYLQFSVQHGDTARTECTTLLSMVCAQSSNYLQFISFMRSEKLCLLSHIHNIDKMKTSIRKILWINSQLAMILIVHGHRESSQTAWLD